MDDPQLPEAVHRQALRGLARLNVLSNAAGLVWRPISKWLEQQGRTEARVLDIASGGGDLAVTLSRVARRQGKQLQVDGIDLSPTAIAHAQAKARAAGLSSQFLARDVLREGVPAGYDILTCSLFLHHLEAGEIETLLRSMNGAGARLVVISDLHRSQLAYWTTTGIVRLVSRSPVVHFDGPQSVRAALTCAELGTLAESAGLPGPTLVRRWPFRQVLVWEPHEEPRS